MDKKIALLIMAVIIGIQAIHFGCNVLLIKMPPSIILTPTKSMIIPTLPDLASTQQLLRPSTPAPSTSLLPDSVCWLML